LATQRCEVSLIVREGKALDENFVKLEALDHLESVEVPDNNVSLKFRKEVKYKVLNNLVLKYYI
jgi:hypothetical protein